MKCCHFKMTGRGKQLQLLAVFWIREWRFTRNKRKSLYKNELGRWNQIFFFFLVPFHRLGKSWHTFFFPSCVSVPFLFSPTLIWSPSATKKPHGRFDQQFCLKAANICLNDEEAFFLFFFLFLFFFPHRRCRHMPPVRKTNMPFALKRRWKRRKKNVVMEKWEMWEEGKKMLCCRNCVSQTSLLLVLNFNAI